MSMNTSSSARDKILPGVDYQIQECGGAEWIVLGTGERAHPYRHDWALVPRNRPHVPVLFGAGGRRTEEEQAKKILALFVPPSGILQKGRTKGARPCSLCSLEGFNKMG